MVRDGAKQISDLDLGDGFTWGSGIFRTGTGKEIYAWAAFTKKEHISYIKKNGIPKKWYAMEENEFQIWTQEITSH